MVFVCGAETSLQGGHHHHYQVAWCTLFTVASTLHQPYHVNNLHSCCGVATTERSSWSRAFEPIEVPDVSDEEAAAFLRQRGVSDKHLQPVIQVTWQLCSSIRLHLHSVFCLPS